MFYFLKKSFLSVLKIDFELPMLVNRNVFVFVYIQTTVGFEWDRLGVANYQITEIIREGFLYCLFSFF